MASSNLSEYDDVPLASIIEGEKVPRQESFVGIAEFVLALARGGSPAYASGLAERVLRDPAYGYLYGLNDDDVKIAIGILFGAYNTPI